MLILFVLFNFMYYLLSVQSASILRYSNHNDDNNGINRLNIPSLPKNSPILLSSVIRNYYRNKNDLISKKLLNKQNDEIFQKYLSMKRSIEFEPVTHDEKQHELHQYIDFLISKYLSDNNNSDCLSSNCNLDNVRLKYILNILSKINDDDPSIIKLIYLIAKNVEYLNGFKNSTLLSRSSASSTTSSSRLTSSSTSDTTSKLILDKYDRNTDGSVGDGGLYSDINLSNNMNLSGRREVPLYIEEPFYIYTRRGGKNKPVPGPDHMEKPPFIPPRGRKYSITPALHDLLDQYELFIPNRGKKDDINDIFKYDDLFFPNRGKRQIKKTTSKLLRMIDYDGKKTLSFSSSLSPSPLPSSLPSSSLPSSSLLSSSRSY